MPKVKTEGYISEEDYCDIEWFYNEIERRKKYGVLLDEYLFAKEDMSENDMNDFELTVELFYEPSEVHNMRKKLFQYVDVSTLEYHDNKIVVSLVWNASMVPQK